MNPSSPIPSGTAQDSAETVQSSVESPDFAREVVREYDESPTPPESIPGKVIHFLSESVRKLKEEGPWHMILYWLETAVDQIGLKKQLDRLMEVTRDSWLGRLFGLGDKLREGLENARFDTVGGILAVALGGILAKDQLGALARSLGDKVGLDELLAAKDAPGGIGAFLVEKVRAGEIEIPSETWDSIRGPLGLPPLSELASEALDTVQRFDRESGLQELRGNLTARLDEQYPDWRSYTEMEWVQDLEDPHKVADALGVDIESPSTWQTIATVAGGTAALGGGYLLLKRLMGGKWAGRITVNVALYAILRSEGVHNVVLAGIDQVRQIETDVCDRVDQTLKDVLRHHGLTPQDVGLEFVEGNQFGVADALEYIADLAHENPAITMMALNAAWFTRHILIGAAKKIFEFIAEGSYRTGKWMWEHKGAAIAMGLTAATIYAKEREFIQDIAELVYPDDPGEQQALLDTYAQYLHDVDFEAPQTFAEKAVDPIYERLLKDPLEFLGTGELKMRLFKDLADGKVMLRMDPSLASVSLGIVAHGNPIWHAINIEAGILESLLTEFANIGNPDENFNVWAVTTLGAEAYVVGRLARGGYKGYVALFTEEITGPNWPKKFFKSMIPFSKENRHLWFSALREAGDSLPFARFTDLLHARRIGHVNRYTQQVIEALSSSDAAAQVPRKVTQLNKYIDSVLTSGYQHIDDFELNEVFRRIKRISEQIDMSKVSGNKAELDKYVRQLRQHLDEISTRWSRLFNLGLYLREGDVRHAVREVMKGSGVRALSADELFKGKSHGDLTTRMSQIDDEIAALKNGDDVNKAVRITQLQRERRAIEAFLDPAAAKLKSMDFEALGKDVAKRAEHVERMALELESVERGVSARASRMIEEIVAQAKARNLPLDHPSIKEMLTKVDEDVILPFFRQKKAYLEILNKEYRLLPKALRTPQLKAAVGLAHESSYLTKVVKGAKGRGIVVVALASLMVASDMLMQKEGSERELHEVLEDLGPDIAQLLVDVVPVVGTYSIYRTAVTGEEWVSGRHVEGWARWSNYIWGTVSLAADVIMVLTLIPSGSGSLEIEGAGRAALAGLKGSSKAQRLLKSWPRIAAIAEKMGWEDLVRATYRFIDSTRKGGRIMKGLRTVEIGGMATGTAIMAGGITMDLMYGQDDADEGFMLAEDIAGDLDASIARTELQHPGMSGDTFVPPGQLQHPTESVEYMSDAA